MRPDEEFQWLLCAYCGNPFHKTGDDWYRIERMHDDRVGHGPMEFGSKSCAMIWLTTEQVLQEDRHRG